MKLLYFSHRYRDPDPSQQWDNLARSWYRFGTIKYARRKSGERLWAPWIELAETDVPEEQAWAVIEAAIAARHGILLDLDGAPESEGMAREREIAERLGKRVEVVR